MEERKESDLVSCHSLLQRAGGASGDIKTSQGKNGKSDGSEYDLP